VIAAHSEHEDLDRLHATVLELLEEWAGFSALQSAMRTYDRTEVFVAGGTLRDLFSGVRPPQDFDLFVDGPDVSAFIHHLAERGTLDFGPFGSPRWWPAGKAAQHADVIPISGFHNGLWKCRDIVDALNQFDFSANAVALDLRSRKLFDPQNGKRDAREKIMRAVRFDLPDEPISVKCSISRLSVLWIRIVHFAHALGFAIEPLTWKWVQENAHFRKDADAFARIFFPPAVDWIGKP
jgi:tRNA nucleotidyltransferase/poly(A) polymerase